MSGDRDKSTDKDEPIRSIPFGERPGDIHYNASEVVVIADSRFLFCDNNISDALFEIRFTPEGELAGPLVRHPIRGVRPEAIDDLECMAMVEVKGTRLLFVSSSLCLKRKRALAIKKNRKGKLSAARESLIRIRIEPDIHPEAEIIPCFRYWLIENAPVLGNSHKWVPQDGGLNIEGLAWDPKLNALVFGLRTPLVDGRPLILRVKVKDPAGMWNLSNLEIMPPITLGIEGADGTQGIRSVEYDPVREAFLIVVGNAVRGSKVPYAMYCWDGNEEGLVTRFKHITFHKKMRPEGVTHGTIGGRGVMMFVDDAQGYQLLWDDDPRLGL